MASLTLKNTVPIFGSMVIGDAPTTTLYARWAPTHSAAPAAEQQRKVLFWYDPIYPNAHFDKSGKSSFMNMDLVPKYADEEHAVTGAPGVHIDPTQTQNLGAETAAVTRGPLYYAQAFLANTSYNKYRYVTMQARTADFINKICPLTVGDKARQGTPLLGLTIPDWVEAQSEYLLLQKIGGTVTQVEGILKRLRLAGMPDDDIRRLKTTRKTQTRFTLRAPTDGVITAFNLRAGTNIAKSNMATKIQGMDPAWVSMVTPESIVWLIKGTSQFAIQVPARSGEAFSVDKWTLLLNIDNVTRTLRLRLQVNNPDGALKPRMNAYLQLTSESEPMLLTPSKALIDGGSEWRMITADNEGRFVPKPVYVFHEPIGITAIRSGLREGEKIVASGLSLIDSEVNITGALERMRAQAPGTAAPVAHAH